MNTTLTITTIALVAVVMGMSAVAPMIPQAFAHDVPRGGDEGSHKICDSRQGENLPESVRRIICNHLK